MAMTCTQKSVTTKNKVYEPNRVSTIVSAHDVPIGTLFKYRSGDNYYIKVGRSNVGLSGSGIVSLKNGVLYENDISSGQIEVVDRLSIEKDAS